MKTPPDRIAVVALALLVLACIGAWWWQSSKPEPTAQAGLLSAEFPAVGGMANLDPRGSGHAPSGSEDAGKRCSTAIRDAFGSRASGLAKTQDANSQLAYALAVPVDLTLDWQRMTPEAHRRAMQDRQDEEQAAMLRAATLARGDPEVLWLAANKCIGGEACDAARHALLQAEPGNMLAWLREMESAWQRGDLAAAGHAFERAASAPEYDAHTGAIKAVIRQAYGALPLPAACASGVAQQALQRTMRLDLGRPFGVLDHAMLMASASTPIPGLGPIRQHCMANTDTTPARRTACRTILSRLAEGDTAIERMFALDVLVQLLGDDPGSATWRERYREQRWLMEQMADTSVQSLLQPEDYGIGEVHSFQAALQVAGRWPPPADWLPQDERARSLILTGRPPPESRR
ncbi:MAG TPA: hypothetical protein VN205_11720 [Thermomonas sp.]|nr:hypothetical protein [Thermomonas sp.]